MQCEECQSEREVRERYDPIFSRIRRVCRNCVWLERWGIPAPKTEE